MYEPPEVRILADKPRSRRYDIWSMGCIYLEFVIWLLYGTSGLKRFQEDLHDIAVGGEATFFFIDANQNAQLNIVVQKWIEYIETDPRCPENTAVHCLVELIVTKLLITESGQDLNLNRVDSAHNYAEPNIATPMTPSILIRAATKLSGPGDDPSAKVRANAKQMYAAMKEILDDAASTRIDWMRWEAPTQRGPEIYAKNLAVLGGKSLGSKEQEVS